VLGRKEGAGPQALVPVIGDERETGIERRAQVLDQVGERVGEVLVFALNRADP
jgi:hypothetical protein